MEVVVIILVIFVAIGGLIYAATSYMEKEDVVIYAGQKGLKYVEGKLVKILDAGTYRINKNKELIQKVNDKVLVISLAAQNVLTADNLGVKVTLSASYKIKDFVKAYVELENYNNALYLELQGALREAVSEYEMDALLKQKKALNSTIEKLAINSAEKLGLEIISVGIKDIMLSAEIKSAYTELAMAKKAGLAKLEKARGESAAIRTMANAAKLMETNSGLLKLKVLDMLKEKSDVNITLNLSDKEIALTDSK